jgi:hypothetical protein
MSHLFPFSRVSVVIALGPRGPRNLFVAGRAGCRTLFDVETSDTALR